MEAHDTICAVSSARGRAALGIFRLSGPRSLDILRGLLLQPRDLPPRQAVLVEIAGENSQLVDEVIAIYYKSPASFTGEDVIELICHGNPLILRELERLFVSRGTRIAEAGEFTRRALANGKLNLSQVESLDLILNSSSKVGVSIGLQAFRSKFELRIEALLEHLKELVIEFQAQLDFPEHEVGGFSEEKASLLVENLQKEISKWLKAYDRYKHYLGKRKIVFLGPPNSGKSSLFNALVGFEKAIVFDKPGTTRDPVDYTYEKEGAEIHLVDTAGIREASDDIERLGILKSQKEAEDADLIIWMSDECDPPSNALKEAFSGKKWLLVHSKSDLGGQTPSPWLPVSIFKPEQLQALEKQVFLKSENDLLFEEDIFITSERQYKALELAWTKLGETVERLKKREPLEWAAQSVLESAASLESVVGKIPHEDTLKSILGRFCIGK